MMAAATKLRNTLLPRLVFYLPSSCPLAIETMPPKLGRPPGSKNRVKVKNPPTPRAAAMAAKAKRPSTPGAARGKGFGTIETGCELLHAMPLFLW